MVKRLWLFGIFFFLLGFDAAVFRLYETAPAVDLKIMSLCILAGLSCFTLVPLFYAVTGKDF